MNEKVKCGLIIGFLGKTKDRFHEYNEIKNLEEKLSLLTEIEDVDGVETVFPYEVNDADIFKNLIKKYNLNIAAINVNIKAEPEFRNGSISSPDKKIREKAINIIKQSKDFAKEVGANKVTCCPLGDGYEFNFQYDYGTTWKYIVDSFSEAADYVREVPLYIEYKPSETRGRCFIDTAAKALCLLNDMKTAETGVTVDFGHSTYGNENPAEVVALLAQSPYKYYVHINDNDGKWDWDYMVGTKHLLDYIEFIYYLQKYNYNDYLTSDTSPTRWDIKGTFEMNARMTNKIWNKLKSIDSNKLENLITENNFLETWKFIESEILSFK